MFSGSEVFHSLHAKMRLVDDDYLPDEKPASAVCFMLKS